MRTERVKLAEVILRACGCNEVMIMAYEAAGGMTHGIFQHQSNPRITALAVAQEAIKASLAAELMEVLSWLEAK